MLGSVRALRQKLGFAEFPSFLRRFARKGLTLDFRLSRQLSHATQPLLLFSISGCGKTYRMFPLDSLYKESKVPFRLYLSGLTLCAQLLLLLPLA